MTKQEYDTLHTLIRTNKERVDNPQGSSYTWKDTTGLFRWELLKAIWELTRVIKGELDE